MEITKNILYLLLTRHYSNIGKRSSSRSLKVIADLWREPSINFEEIDVSVTADKIIQASKNLEDSAPS